MIESKINYFITHLTIFYIEWLENKQNTQFHKRKNEIILIAK